MRKVKIELPPVPARFRHTVGDLLVWCAQLPRVKCAVLPTTTFRSNPLPVGDRLFASVFSPGAVIAVDRNAGQRLWRRRITPFAGSQLLFSGSILYAKSPHSLYGLHPEDGRLIWTFSPHGTRGETMYSAPSVGGGRLFIGDRAGYLHALNAETGQPAWSVLTSRAKNNDVNGPPLVDGEQVVVATNAGRVLCLDARTGKVIWTQSVGSPSTHEIGVVPGGFLVASTFSLCWLNPSTGALLSRRSFPRRWILSYICRGRLTLAVLASKNDGSHEIAGLRDDAVVFRRDEEFLDSLRWLPDGSIVETRFDGLGVLDPTTGERLHDVRFSDECGAAPPAIGDRHLYALTRSGRLLALRWPPPEGSSSHAA